MYINHLPCYKRCSCQFAPYTTVLQDTPRDLPYLLWGFNLQSSSSPTCVKQQTQRSYKYRLLSTSKQWHSVVDRYYATNYEQDTLDGASCISMSIWCQAYWHTWPSYKDMLGSGSSSASGCLTGKHVSRATTHLGTHSSSVCTTDVNSSLHRRTVGLVWQYKTVNDKTWQGILLAL